MHYEVLALFDHGKRKPKKAYSSEPRLTADVRIHKEMQTPLGRPARVAITAPATKSDSNPLPPLYDAKVDGIATLALTIEGFEFIDGMLYQQTWHCRESDHKFVAPWSLCPSSPLDELL